MSMFDDYAEQQEKTAKQARVSKQQQQQQPGSRPKPSDDDSSGPDSSSESEDEQFQGKSQQHECSFEATAGQCCCSHCWAVECFCLASLFQCQLLCVCAELSSDACLPLQRSWELRCTHRLP
jgi:hypothetical protein